MILFFEALYNYLNDSKPTIMPLVSNKKEYYPIFEELCNEFLNEKISSIMIYLEKKSDNYPLSRWESKDTLGYYLETRKNYDKPKLEPEIERRENESNLNYAELDLKYYEESLDYYLKVIG